MNEGPWLECAINTPSWVLSTCSNFARVGYRRQPFTKSCGYVLDLQHALGI
jgi:hypothetical protein